MATRSILSSICVPAAFVFEFGLKWPETWSMIPILVLIFLRRLEPRFRSWKDYPASYWIISATNLALLVAGYYYHILWLEIAALVVMALKQVRYDFTWINDHAA